MTTISSLHYFGSTWKYSHYSLAFPDDVINGMTAADLISAMQSTRPIFNEFKLLMPKFKIEYNFDSAKDVLKELGVTEIFARGVGDFGNLFTEVSYTSRCAPRCDPTPIRSKTSS